MKLIDNVSDLHKMYVVQVLAAIAVFNLTWAELPAEIKADLPAHFVYYVNAGLSALGVFVRALKQFGFLPADEA